MSPVEGAYETIARALKLSEVALSTRAKTDLVEFFRRFVLSLLTGNGDMHLENIAILGARTDRGLSPVFDPAPMRAFPRHSQLTALRWFTNDAPSFAYIPANLAERLKQLGKHFDVRPRRAREIIAAALDVTSEFDARCRQSEEIPPFTAERLAAEIAGVRYRLEESVKLAAEWA
jgi:serine/threonine-protein kinase HipA